jgi:hypothetical protein
VFLKVTLLSVCNIFIQKLEEDAEDDLVMSRKQNHADDATMVWTYAHIIKFFLYAYHINIGRKEGQNLFHHPSTTL